MDKITDLSVYSANEKIKARSKIDSYLAKGIPMHAKNMQQAT
jgi:hypothetical protein